jgi:hypothetical protein
MPTTKQNDLDALSLDELRTRYHEATGEVTKDRSKKRLIARITEARESIAALEKGKELRAEAEAEPEPAPKAKASRKKAKAAEPATDADDADDDGEKKPAKMTIEELREAYREIVGRETNSENRRYLIWRLAQAKKGRIPTGPRAGRTKSGPQKVLPVRTPAAAVEPLGEARKRLGLRSRNDLILRALHYYLAQNGEAEVANLLIGDDAGDDE